jgi:hypothetical protein
LTIVMLSSNVDGMSDMNDLAVAASGADVRTGLRAALALRRLAERLETLQVSNARRQGWSWQEIAEALEVSKQAVHQKHAAHAAQPESGRGPARKEA